MTDLKIYILADMEGISGIRRMKQVKAEFAGDYEVLLDGKTWCHIQPIAAH